MTKNLFANSLFFFIFTVLLVGNHLIQAQGGTVINGGGSQPSPAIMKFSSKVNSFQFAVLISSPCNFGILGTFEGSLIVGMNFDSSVNRDVLGFRYNETIDTVIVEDLTLEAYQTSPTKDSVLGGVDNVITILTSQYGENEYTVQVSRACSTGDALDFVFANSASYKTVFINLYSDQEYKNLVATETRVGFVISTLINGVQDTKLFPTNWNEVKIKNNFNPISVYYALAFEGTQRSSKLIFWKTEITHSGFVGIVFGDYTKIQDAIYLTTTAAGVCTVSDYNYDAKRKVLSVDSTIDSYDSLLKKYNSTTQTYTLIVYRFAQTNDFKGDVFIDDGKCYTVGIILGNTMALAGGIKSYEFLPSISFTINPINPQGFSLPSAQYWKDIVFNSTTRLSFAYSQMYIWFNIIAENEGWIALGFGNNMTAMDVISIYDSSGTPVLEDRYSEENEFPMKDSEKGGVDDELILFSGGLIENHWNITFFRRWSTGDQFDKNLASSGKQTSLCLAFGESQDITKKHKSVSVVNNIWIAGSIQFTQGNVTFQLSSFTLLRVGCLILILFIF